MRECPVLHPNCIFAYKRRYGVHVVGRLVRNNTTLLLLEHTYGPTRFVFMFIEVNKYTHSRCLLWICVRKSERGCRRLRGGAGVDRDIDCKSAPISESVAMMLHQRRS